MASIAPVAKGLGQSLQQTTAQLGVLVNNGIEASTAGTMLRNMMLKATKDGFSMDEALREIASSTDKAGTSLKYFDTRATATALVLADNIKAVKGLNDELLDSSGAAKDMADIMDKTLEGSMMKLKSATEGMGIAFGEILAPAIGKIANFLSDIAMKFAELSEGTKKTITIIAALAAAIGPLIFLLGGLSVAFAFLLANPIVLAITGIALAVGALAMSMVDVNDKIKEVSKSTKILTKASEEAKRQISGETERVKSYYDALRQTNKGSQERADLIETINRTYGATLKNLEDETAFVNQLDTSYNDLIKSLKTKIKLGIQEDSLTELVKVEAGIQSIIDAIEGKIYKDGDFSQGYNMGIPYEEILWEREQILKQYDLLDKNLEAQEKLLSGSFFEDIAATPPPTSTTKKIVKSIEDSLDGMVVPMPTVDFSKLNIGNPNDLVKVEPYEIDLEVNKGGFDEVIEKLDSLVTKAQEIGQEMGAALNNGLQNLVTEGLVSLGQFIGDVMSGGDMTVQDFGRGLLDSIGKFMGQFGEAMIAMGIAQTLLKASIATMNPAAAIIGGVALVAAGAAISNLSKKGVDSGSSAPSPSYSGSGSAFNNSDNGYSFENNITLSGRDMIITQKRERAFGR
jgi:hypothetical protein